MKYDVYLTKAYTIEKYRAKYKLDGQLFWRKLREKYHGYSEIASFDEYDAAEKAVKEEIKRQIRKRVEKNRIKKLREENKTREVKEITNADVAKWLLEEA